MLPKKTSAPNQENAEIDKEFIHQIGNMFQSLQRMLQDNLPLMANQVESIIQRQEKDSNQIARVLDYLLDYTRHGVGDDVYLKLIDYYHSVDEKAAADYMRYYEEEKE